MLSRLVVTFWRLRRLRQRQKKEQHNSCCLGSITHHASQDSLITVVMFAQFLSESMRASLCGTSELLKGDAMVEFEREFLLACQTGLALQDSGAGWLAVPAWKLICGTN